MYARQHRRQQGSGRTMPIYVGADRRQVGGSLFGNGIKTILPLVLKKLFHIIKPGLNQLGQHAINAGRNATTSLLQTGFENAGNKILKSFKTEGSAIKRKMMNELGVDQTGEGYKRRRRSKKTPGNTTPSKRKTTASKRKKSINKHAPSKKDIFS